MPECCCSVCDNVSWLDARPEGGADVCPHCGSAIEVEPEANAELDELAILVRGRLAPQIKPAHLVAERPPRNIPQQILWLSVAGLTLLFAAWGVGTHLPRMATGQPPPSGAEEPIFVKTPALPRPDATSGDLQTMRNLEARALAAEAAGDLTGAMDAYERLLQVAHRNPETARREPALVARAQRESRLLMAWQMLIESGHAGCEKPTSTDNLFDRRP